MWRRGTPASRRPARAAIPSGPHTNTSLWRRSGTSLFAGAARTGGRLVARARRAGSARSRRASLGDPVQLVLQHDVGRMGRAVDQRDVAGGAGQRLEQRPQRRDPDPAGEQQHLAAGAPSGGERAVRALGEDPGAGLQCTQAGAVVAGDLDGDAQPVRTRCGADSEYGLAGPPQIAGEEPPAEELARLGPQLVQVLGR